MGCFEIMLNGTRSLGHDDGSHSGLRFNICRLETSHKLNKEVADLEERVASNIPAELQYSVLYWMEHLLGSSVEEGTLGDEADGEWNSAKLSGMLSKFLETEYSLFWLEVLSLTDNVKHAVEDWQEKGMLDRLDRHSNLPVCVFVSSSTHTLIVFLDVQFVHPTRVRDGAFCARVRPSHLSEHAASLLLPHVDTLWFATLDCLGNALCTSSSAAGTHP